MKKLFFLLFLVVLLSCEKLRYGNVIKKEYHPEYTSTMLLPLVISTGKTTTIVMIPYFVHHNESWSIDVRGTGVKGHSITRTFYIDRNSFDTTKIGTFICVKGLCDEDTALHKTRK